MSTRALCNPIIERSHTEHTVVLCDTDDLRVTRESHARFTYFTIQSVFKKEPVSIQCYTDAAYVKPLAERIKKLTAKGYFDPHPHSIKRLGQYCAFLVVNNKLVKYRNSLDTVIRAYYERDTSAHFMSSLESIMGDMPNPAGLDT